jgi:hypothetical protein
MIYIRNKKCNCKKTPVFNFENEKTGRFCSVHKLDGMIDV